MKTIAFAVPILPGKTDAWRAFAAEIVGPRKSQFEQSQKEVHVTAENWYLQQTPHGDMAIIYMEGEDPASALGHISQSQGEFEMWFKEQALEIHGMDLSQPMPGPIAEVINEWSA